MNGENQDIIGHCCVRDDQGIVALSNGAKEVAWKEHLERLLNVEFPWSAIDLPQAKPIAGPSVLITPEMVAECEPDKAPDHQVWCLKC